MIVLEYAPKGSLNKFLRSSSGSGINVEGLCQYVIEAARGMCYLVEKNVRENWIYQNNLNVYNFTFLGNTS